MDERTDQDIQDLLRRAMSRMNDCELRRDLWPSMLRHLEHKPISATWLDWALIAFLLIVFVSFPRMLPVLLYFL